MKNQFLTLLLGVSTLFVSAQQDQWDAYLAEYPEGPGSTTLNMSLSHYAPYSGFPFLVITGVKTQNCDNYGFPTQKEFDVLYQISDEVIQILDKKTNIMLAGSFTYQCQRLDYIYVSDTSDLRELLSSFYKEKHASYEEYISIKEDASWEAYTQFLYPDEFTQEFMNNQVVLDQLSSHDDDLTKSRPVDHWIYFSKTSDRKAFSDWAKGEGFTCEDKEAIEKSKYPYPLLISREDYVTLDKISELSYELRLKARELGGEYDGWETVVVK